MRFDSEGLFWVDLPPEPEVRKTTKVVAKRIAPYRSWEDPGYLPDIERARAFNVLLFGDQELVDAAISRTKLLYDIECYSNYFLVCFRSLDSKKVVYFEMYDGHPLDVVKLEWVARNFCLIGFNSIAYDLPMLQLALAGASCQQLKEASDIIVSDVTPGWQLAKQAGCPEPDYNHIDLIQVAPLGASLKLYGGRLHCPRMWDLPFPPEATLSPDQMVIVRWYCVNDLDLTEILYWAVEEQISLRMSLSGEYEKDLRSKGDAQIAEAIITGELKKLGCKVGKAEVAPGTVFKYVPPAFVKFKTSYMRRVLGQIRAMNFVVGEDGYTDMPQELAELKIKIANGVYQMGIGGLHSCEKSTYHHCDGSFILEDRDVASYYPALILNCGLYPEHLGKEFLQVYKGIVDRRLAAKRSKNKVMADSLKITVNGTFGKLGSKWSVLYSPSLLFQVTITGQLGLLMLIESLELADIAVISANTDGVVSKIPNALKPAYLGVVADWEKATGFETEAVEYLALYSRDVNNYIAFKKEGGTKNKGAYANPWADTHPSIFRLHKNPTTTICIEAVEKFLSQGIPLLQTIQECTDIKKFVAIRTVRGGAVYEDIYLGKAIRWYYSTNTQTEIIYASTGNKVAKSDGACPLMELPAQLPSDINYDWYAEEASAILEDLGIKLV